MIHDSAQPNCIGHSIFYQNTDQVIATRGASENTHPGVIHLSFECHAFMTLVDLFISCVYTRATVSFRWIHQLTVSNLHALTLTASAGLALITFLHLDFPSSASPHQVRRDQISYLISEMTTVWSGYSSIGSDQGSMVV